jgi:elongation factor 1-alpha
MGQTRQHSLLINLLGVKQIIVGINKMDCDVAKYGEARYNEIRDESMSMLEKVGWKKTLIEKEVSPAEQRQEQTILSPSTYTDYFYLPQVPFLPISGWMGDNLIKKSENMPWWKGMDVLILGDANKKIHIDTLHDALDKMVQPPGRKMDVAMRTPLSGVYKIKGVGDVLTGRVEQGKVSPGDEVIFLPTHTTATPCTGKVFTVEMHHKQVDAAGPGDNVGMNVKGLDKANMPRVGDIMVLKTDTSIGRVRRRVSVFVFGTQKLTRRGFSFVLSARTLLLRSRFCTTLVS